MIVLKQSLVWNRIKIPVNAILWLTSILVILLSTYQAVPIYSYLLFGVLAVAFFSVSDRVAFFFYILLVLVTVFFFLFLAFKDHWQPIEQAINIGLHSVFLVHLFALYSLSKYTYIMSSENRFFRGRIAELEEFVFQDGILTKREFDKQSKLVLSNMRRRKETGFYIEISVGGLKRPVRKKVLHRIGSMLHTTFRQSYDLIGQSDEFTLVVLVQNTNQQGLEIAIKRFNVLLIAELEEDTIDKISVSVKEIDTSLSLDEAAVIK